MYDYINIIKYRMYIINTVNKIKKDDPANPDVCMVYYYHKLVNNEDNINKVCSECKQGSRGCVQCKKELIEAMKSFLEPIQERRKFYEDNPDEVRKVLEEGTKAAREKAIAKMSEIKKAMKIDY